MDPEILLDPPKGSDSAALADWAELWVFTSELETLSRQHIKRALQDEPEDEEEPDDGRAGAELEVSQLESVAQEEGRTDRLLSEVRRRAEVAPRVYRLRVDSNVITGVDVPAKTIYELLLWIAFAGAPFRDGRDAEVEQPFDELCLAALKVLVGPSGEGVMFARRYAVNPATDERRPTSFPLAIRWLRGLLRLPAGLDAVPDGPPSDDEGDHPARTYSDGGVDVVAWRHFKDGRAGFPSILAQCTIQLRWRPKATDIVLDLWGDWIRFVTPPQKVLAIPFAVPEGRSWWRDRNRTAGIVIDRMRLCELLNELSDGALQTLQAAQMAIWLDGDRERFLEVQAP